MRSVLLHYHILKNGGSTIEEILRRSFAERFVSFDHAGADAEIKPAELLTILNENPRCQAFSSHQIFYPVPQVRGFLFFDICFLRDPIDRIRSIYDYFRGKPTDGNPVRELANQETLGEFTRRLIDDMPWVVNDVQVNLLAKGIVNDQPVPDDLDRGIERMLETSFLGVVDRFNESLVAGEHSLRIMFPALDCAQSAVNDSAKPGSTLADRVEQFRSACEPSVFEELLRLNAMDLELLRRAREEVRRRFENVPDHDEALRCLKERMAGEARQIEPKRKPQSREFAQVPSPDASTKAARWLRWLAHVRASKPASQFRLLFDAMFYRDAYPDIGDADPLRHFVTTGAFEGRDPHPLFDTDFYLEQLTAPPEINALCDYLDRGAALGLKPHRMFDGEFYARRYADVGASGMNPLVHYILHGAAEGRKPHPLFEPEYYLASCPAARSASNPLVYFVMHEADGRCRPHPFFEGDLANIPEVKPPSGIATLSIMDVEIPIAFFECVRRDQAGINSSTPAAQLIQKRTGSSPDGPTKPASVP
jgi:hypothetical protein